MFVAYFSAFFRKSCVFFTTTHSQPSHSQMFQTKHWNPSLYGFSLANLRDSFLRNVSFVGLPLDLPTTRQQPILHSRSHYIHPTQPLIPSALSYCHFVSQHISIFRPRPAGMGICSLSIFHFTCTHALPPNAFTNVSLLLLTPFSCTPYCLRFHQIQSWCAQHPAGLCLRVGAKCSF